MLKTQFIPLDALFWEPGWVQAPPDRFKAKVLAAFKNAGDSWVMDGNYTRHIGPLVDRVATDVICKLTSRRQCARLTSFKGLDPPFILYFPRLCFRTFRRLFRLEPGCSEGCFERFTEVFFSSDSIVLWCITHHRPVKKRGLENMQRDGIHLGGKYRRIGGWGRELREWKQGVADMLRMAESD